MPASKDAEKPKDRKTRRHSPRQLIDRPVTLDSCRGPVVIGAQIVGGVPVVQITYPSDVAAYQPPRQA